MAPPPTTLSPRPEDAIDRGSSGSEPLIVQLPARVQEQANIKEEHETVPTRTLTVADLPRWQQCLTQERPDTCDWPITRLCLPGTHDSATYGSGSFPTNVARFNWHCQASNIYEQAKLGIRYFDLRLERANNASPASQYWPFHGAAKRTGDLFADGPKGFRSESGTNEPNWAQTIAGQLLRFVTENPSEVIVIHLTLKDESNYKGTLWETLHRTLGEDGKCIPRPESGDSKGPGAIPTITEIRERKQKFVIIADANPSSDGNATAGPNIAAEPDSWATFQAKYVWKMPGCGVLEGPYTSQIWKSNDPTQVRKAIEDWMTKNETTIADLTYFWAAQCQLTPSMNNICDLIKSLWNKKITTTPAKLSPIMNPYVREVLMQDPKWRSRVSMVQIDFADPETVLSILDINLDSSR